MQLDLPPRTVCADKGVGGSCCSSFGSCRGRKGGGGGGEEGGRKAGGGEERESERERVGVNERVKRRLGSSPSSLESRLSVIDLSHTWRERDERGERGGEAIIHTDTDTDTDARTPPHTSSRMWVPELSYTGQERERVRDINTQLKTQLNTGIRGGGDTGGRREDCVLDFGHVTPLMRAAMHGHSQAVVSLFFSFVFFF